MITFEELREHAITKSHVYYDAVIAFIDKVEAEYVANRTANVSTPEPANVSTEDANVSTPDTANVSS